jgi:WD40 repeat protein
MVIASSQAAPFGCGIPKAVNPLIRLSQGTDRVTSIAFSPDGSRIVSGSIDKTVRLWDSQAGKPAQLQFKHTNSISSMAISPDHQRLVSVNLDDEIEIRDIKRWGLLAARVERKRKGISSVAVITASDLAGTVWLWDEEKLELLSQSEISVDGLASRAGILRRC